MRQAGWRTPQGVAAQAKALEIYEYRSGKETVMDSGGGGGTQTTSTIQKSDPWAEQKPFLEFGFEEAKNQYQDAGPSFFGGQTYADMTPQQQLALQAGEQRALTGSAQTQGAQGLNLETLQGDFLQNNPNFTAMMDVVEGDVRQRVDPRFEADRRYGSGLHAQQTAKELASAGSQLAYQNYGDERARQEAAIGRAPGLAQADYADIGQLMGVGEAYQGMDQAAISEAMQRHNFEQNLPANKLAQYQGLIGGTYGGTSTSSQQTPVNAANPFMQALGAGATATSIAGGLFGGADPLFNKPWP